MKTLKGECCVFPFVYHGKTYNSCTITDHNKPWCSLTPSYDDDERWGYCEGKLPEIFYMRLQNPEYPNFVKNPSGRLVFWTEEGYCRQEESSSG